MDALFARITASLNEQQALLEAAVNARTGAATNANGNTNNITAANVATVGPDGAAAAQGTEENNGLQLEVTQMGNRLKMLIPVVILITFKVLADNFIVGSLSIMSISGFYRLKAAFELELALKERSSKFTVGGLCLLSTGLLLTVLHYIDLFGYHGTFVDRLLFSVPDASFKVSLLQTIWTCAVTDGIMQLLILTLKMYAVSSISLASQVSVGGLKSLCRIPRAWTGREGILGARFGGAHGSPDLEGGGSFSHSSEPAAAVSAFIGSISGLVRRQVSSLHAHAGSSGAAYSIVNATEPVLPVATAVDTDGVNSSDGSASDCDSKDFLLKVRVCSLIDVAGLVYRSALPTILWAEYFATCATIGTVLQVIYLAVKLYDCTWKVKGAAQAIYLFASNTLEFGHYSSTEELRGREDGSCDCPVCFDNPHMPVTLDCQHIFCEVCILEWLEKEQTCPVCRAQVHCCNPLLQAVKTDAASTVPIAV